MLYFEFGPGSLTCILTILMLTPPGFLFAELLQKFGKDVDSSKIVDTNKTASKIQNFIALAPAFKVRN